MLTIAECWEFLESQVGGRSALPLGATESAILKAESSMRVEFPDDFRELLLRHDGSGRYHISPYNTGGGCQTFMSISDILSTWKSMVEIGADFENDGEFGEQTGPVKENYWNKRWIPFAENGCGDNIVVDLDPPSDGTLGQIVDWWHEGGVSTYQAATLQDWLNDVVDEIKDGVYKFGRS